MKTIKYIPILTIYFTITICSKQCHFNIQVVFNELTNRTIDDNENGIDTVKMPAIRSLTEAMAQGNNRFDISSSLMVTKN